MKPIKWLFLFCTICAFSVQSFATTYELSPDIQRAYDAVMTLRLTQAQADIQAIQRDDPDNHLLHLIDNQRDFMILFVHERASDYDWFMDRKNARLSALKKGNSSHPYYRYLQAEVRMQSALIKLKFGHYFGAFTEVNKAFKLLRENQRRFPDFKLNEKTLGMLHAFVGSIPDEFRWGIELISSLSGDVEGGMREIREALDYCRKKDHLFLKETEVVYAYCLLHLMNEREAVVDFLEKSSLDPTADPLACFVIANVALRCKQNDRVIELLEHRPKGPTFETFHYLDFMLGLAKTYRQDPDAERYLKHYVEHFQGRHYIKEAYQKLAWNRLVRGDEAGYRSYMRACLKNGWTLIDEDERAHQEAESGVAPNGDLLKARLLFDGGYASTSLEVLESIAASDLVEVGHWLERTYRMGRAYQELDQWHSAIKAFEHTIESGKGHRYYFVCNAVLQLGTIQEKLGKCEQAKEAYRHCLRLNPDSYKKSLHQKAKAALNRLEC